MSLATKVAAIADGIFDPSDLLASTLDDRQKVRCAAVIVLAHAEIEEEIETACRGVANSLKANPPVGFAFVAWGLAAAKLSKREAKAHWKQFPSGSTVEKMVQAYADVIENSHGITREHLERLLAPLGVDTGQLGLDIDALNEFARKRGAAAHLSPLKTTQQDAPSKTRADAISAAGAATVVIAAVVAQGQALAKGTPTPPRKGWLPWLLGR